MDLTGGAVAKAIAKAAGPTLQAECSKKAPIAAGEIAVTGPGKMQCKCIIHVNCPGYDKSGGQAEEVSHSCLVLLYWVIMCAPLQMLRTIMNKCMGECESQGASTIVFPAIGTGNLQFPAATSAHVMVDEVCNYLQKNKCKSLSNIYIMIYNDSAMHRLFSEELEKRKQSILVPMKKKKRLFWGRHTDIPLPNEPTDIPDVVSHHTDIPPPSEPTHIPRIISRHTGIAIPTDTKSGGAVKPSGNHSLDFGNGVSMEILKGDITQENTDVIVNTTNKNMVLDSGVSLALSKKAGKSLQEACNALKPTDKKGLRDGKVIETKSGNLHCKCVFHVMFRKDKFVEVVSVCIEKARELKHKSISFPAIGTGQEKYPADAAAKDMIKGMQQCRTGSQIQVRIVLFQQEVYSQFIQVIEGQAIMPEPTAVVAQSSACRDQALPVYESEPIGAVTIDSEIKIFGETHEYVKSAEKILRELINRQFKTENITEKMIRLLSESQVRVLEREAHSNGVIFHIDRSLSVIELEGNVNGINEMKLKITIALSKVEKAQVLVKTVRWKRQDSSEGTDYDPLVNLEIEEHKEKSTYTFKDDVTKDNFTIDYKQMKEIDHALGDRARKIIRVEVGKHW